MFFCDLSLYILFGETMRLMSIMSYVYTLSLAAVRCRIWSVSPKDVNAIGMEAFVLC